MKNITQYLVDTVKSSETTAVRSNGNTKPEKGDNGSKEKRNRVKIRISRTSTKERVCDIIETNNDMVNKTPSPYTKEKTADKNAHETPKRSSSSKLSSVTLKKSDNNDLDYLSLETGKCKKQNDKSNSENSLKHDKKRKKQLEDKKDTNSNTTLCSTFKNKDLNLINVVNVNTTEDECNHEESNAFQILMSRNKQIQNISHIKVLENEDVNTKKSEEYKAKLKRSKERLIVLADKKGYSKRKLSEIQEGGKIEHIIQNRIKVFKEDEKKGNNVGATIFSQTQTCGSLLNYFSKAPVDLTGSDISNMSTIVVKADVHMAENSFKPNVYTLNSNSETQQNRKNRLDMEFSEIDNINVIESENINTHNKTRKFDQCGHNKRRWSLRIKLQNYEGGNFVSDNSSDEEIFSLHNKTKLSIKNSKKSGIIKSIDSEELSLKDKNPKETSKQVNDQTKLKYLKYELSENTKYNNLKQKNKLISDDYKSTSADSNNLENCINSSVEDCILINDSKLKKKAADKLAPLFTKRQKPDPETTAARRLFLQPDITDKSKNLVQKVNVNSTLPFPVLSHITQLSSLICNQTNNFNIPKELCAQYTPVLNVSNYKCIMNFSEVKLEPLKNIKPKVQEVLVEIEKFCTDARKMWNAISLIFKEYSNKPLSPKVGSKKNKQLQERERVACKHNENQFENCTWTSKYRPKFVEDVIGNEEAAKKLKEWIIRWKTFTNENVSSGDEFDSSDSNSANMHKNNQVAVLLGPYGSGKTASVYAVAEEFGYTVLEVNASSRRTGKKLLKELEEATKSHRIKKETSTSAFHNLILDDIVPKKIPQNSLILIEDIDLVFEEDEGFISATYQLASNTKRPIVMTCRDTCPHLSKVAPQQNRIYFKHVTGSRVFAFLELISLAETGYRLPTDYITELVQTGDLRKAILKLQHILDDVANKLDNIVLLSSLIDIEDSALNLWQIKTQPSLSLVENTDLYSASSNICLDMAEWINRKVICNSHLNYFPCLRTICRAEESRSNMNNKRGNRFFHYLHSLKAPSVLLKSNILAAACKIMHDKK
ncbi:ATPase family AAA domain-containing protein 5 [Dufourea novaeangliae]|uniref:ATPase family AAA domain-containing protein 5 n=1 Tax=Dufourea novaeangliae TaxID=178035 RepID=A0A154PGI3_DUFNO|nr:ATPase family AAA domain-containing protein 5 [Dufourea novaeangliae]